MNAISTDKGNTLEPTHASPILPNEVIENVIQQMNDPSTLATMMRVSRRMYEVAAPRLYCEVDMTYNNAKGLYSGIGLADVMGKGKSIKSGDGKETNKEDVPTVLKPGNTALTDTTSDISLPFSKRELLSMINHLNIHDIPSHEDCECLASIATAQIIPRFRRPMTISIRPYAAYLLMANRIFQHSNRYHEPHMFLLFLRELHWEHLCIQLPVMDKDVEDDHSRFRSDAWEHKDKARDRLREALTQHDESDNSVSRDFFDLIHPEPRCQSVTIHNLVLSMSNHALAARHPSIGTLRAFFRPCVTADGELTNKRTDILCINHRQKADITAGGVNLSHQALENPANVEFIDIDWVRGKYQADRDDGPLRSMEQMVDAQVQRTSEAEREGWGEKSFKMARDAEPCRCCRKGQLSIAESSISYRAPHDLVKGSSNCYGVV